MRHYHYICADFLPQRNKYRTSILECDAAVQGTEAGDEIEIDFNAGIIKNLTKGTAFRSQPFPEFMKR